MFIMCTYVYIYIYIYISVCVELSLAALFVQPQVLRVATRAFSHMLGLQVLAVLTDSGDPKFRNEKGLAHHVVLYIYIFIYIYLYIYIYIYIYVYIMA